MCSGFHIVVFRGEERDSSHFEHTHGAEGRRCEIDIHVVRKQCDGSMLVEGYDKSSKKSIEDDKIVLLTSLMGFLVYIFCDTTYSILYINALVEVADAYISCSCIFYMYRKVGRQIILPVVIAVTPSHPVVCVRRIPSHGNHTSSVEK